MDTKIKLLIFLLFTCLSVFGQEPPLNLAVRLQITSAVGSDPYTVTGVVSDDLSRFIADDIQVGDSLYVLDGSFVYVLGITSITSVVGPTIVFVANDPNDAGISLPTGQAAIIRPTVNYKLPTYISGLRDDLRSAIMNRQAQLIDNISGGGSSSITDFISAGAGVPPSAAASSNGGETWRNMTTGELWGSNGSIWYPYTRGPKECQDTVLVSAITVQSGGSLTTGSPLVRNTSGVWEHMYNHPSGTNLIPDGVVTDIITGPKAIIQYCGVMKGSGATPNTSYYVDQTVSTGFTTTKPTTNIRPLGKVAANGDFLINSGLLFSRDNASNNKIVISSSAPTDTFVTWANTSREKKGAYPMYRYRMGWIQTDQYWDKILKKVSNGVPMNFGISGQSNIVGPFSGVRSVDNPDYVGDTLSSEMVYAVNYSGTWNKAVIGVWPPLFVSNTYGATHSMVAAKRISEKTGKTVRLIISGTGGQPIEFWRPGAVGWQELDSTLQRAYRTGMGKLDAFLWFHGEAGSTANTYQAQWDSLVARLRTRQYFDSTGTMIIAPSQALAISDVYPGSIVSENVLRALDYDGDPATKYIRPIERKEINTNNDLFHYTPREHETIGRVYADQILSWSYRDNPTGRSIVSTTNSITRIYPRQDSIINLYNLRTNNAGAFQNKYSFAGSTNYTLVENIKPTGSSSGYQIDYHFNGSSTPSATINSTGFRSRLFDVSSTWDQTTVNPSGGIQFQDNGGVGNDRVIAMNSGGDLLYNSGNGKHKFQFQLTDVITIDQAKVGIANITSPTAKIHIAAGTATAQSAPLKFTAGTNMTTQEAGAVEWDGTNLFITQTIGPTRKTIAYTTDIKVMREESFTSTSGQTAFTIAYSAPAVSGTSVPIRVYRNGVRLFYVASGPTITQFTYSGTTVTTAANTTGDIITIEYLN